MKHNEFKKLLQATFGKMVVLTDSKGVEYANDKDQLANFKRLGRQLGLPPEAVCFVYLQKHLDSIQHYLKYPDKKLAEPITGRIDDALLYLVLLKALVVEQ